MANIANYGAKLMLDLVGKGSSAATPATVAVGICSTSPTVASSYEVGTGSGYSALAVTFASAVTAAGGTATILNSNAMTFGPFSSGFTAQGLIVKDTAATGGNMIFFGNLATARTLLAGDSLVLSGSALSITLA